MTKGKTYKLFIHFLLVFANFEELPSFFGESFEIVGCGSRHADLCFQEGLNSIL